MTTKHVYYSVWKNFNEFFIRLDEKPSTWEDRLVLYVGYMVKNKKQSATIASYISALKAVLKMDGVEVNENHYLLNALTKACRLKNDKLKIRLPIQYALMKLIIKKTEDHFENQPYLSIMYQALFMSCYYSLLRVGEVTESKHVIKACDIHIGHNKRKMMFALRSSKTHGKHDHPQLIKISHHVKTNHIKEPEFCPDRIIRTYIKLRKSCYHT